MISRPSSPRSYEIDGIEVGSRAMLTQLLDWYDGHQLHPVIDRVFGAEEIECALDYLRSGAHFGKVVLSFA